VDKINQDPNIGGQAREVGSCST